MTYFLVMGSLALSVLFTFGWALSRLLRWVASGFSPGGGKRAAKPRRSATKPQASSKTSANAAAKPKAKTGTRGRPAAKPAGEPWRITRLLAEWRSSMALALVAAFTYLVVRLAEHGMSYRPPHTLPSGFETLLTGLGWLSASLILLALLQRLAAWRCR